MPVPANLVRRFRGLGLAERLTFPIGSLGFTPKSIAGLALWLDASDAATITQVANAVSQWRDKSGNNNHASQATGTAQPLIQAAAQNGLNTLGFTSAASKLLTLTTPIAPLSGFTLAAVGQKSGTAIWNAITGTSGVQNYGLLSFSDSFFYSANGATSRLTTSGGTTITFPTYASLIMANAGVVAGSTFLFNGVSQPLFVSNNGDGTGWNTIGGSANTFFTDGSFAEIILYNTTLSPSQLTQLYNYLKSKWGTP